MSPSDGSPCDGLHRFEDQGWQDLVVRYVCRRCGSSVQVEFPTQRDWTAVRAWLDRHPGTLRVREGPPAD